MKQSPLLATCEREIAAVGEYRGSRVALAWRGEPPLDSWPGSPRLYDASFRAALRVAGPEARKWLNGMISANVRDLAPGRVAPAFQLDPKGHVLATLEIACESADVFWLLTTQDQVAGLAERLRRFIFLSKLTLDDCGETLTALRLSGLRPAGGWPFGAAAEPGTMRKPAAGEAVFVCTARCDGVGQAEYWLAPAAAGAAWTALAQVAPPAGASCCERERILRGEPRYGVDITAGELPQETAQLEALDFTKGCYVGQEIVERIRARGAVHRQWVRMRFAARVEPGGGIRAGGEAVGRITSATWVGAGADGAWMALGYVRRPHDAPGSALEDAQGVPGVVLEAGAAGAPPQS